MGKVGRRARLATGRGTRDRVNAASSVGLSTFRLNSRCAAIRKKCAERFRRTVKTVRADGCQLPMEGLPVGTSFEVMSKVSMNPFVPLNS
jgi:hypothetical protein